MGSDFDIDRVSKRRMVTMYLEMQKVSQTHLQLSYQIAVELYRYDPEAAMFLGNTFVSESLRKIHDGCADKYRCDWHGKWLFLLVRWFIRKLTPRRYRG